MCYQHDWFSESLHLQLAREFTYESAMPGAVYVEYYWENREQRKLFSEATRHVVLVAFLSVLSAHLAIPKDSL